MGVPSSSWVHLVFHVSCSKKLIGENISVKTILLELDDEGKIILEPKKINETRITKLPNQTIREYLKKWKNLPIKDSTWED